MLGLKKILPFFLLITATFGFSAEKYYSLPEPTTQEEALFLRRISEFWNEGEFDIVKSQINVFIDEYPESTFCPILHAILGDLLMKGKDYEGAIQCYNSIQKEDLAKEFLLNKLQCLRELKEHAELIEECKLHMNTFASSDVKKHQKLVFLLAEALYQEALQSPKGSEERRTFAAQAKTHYEFLVGTDLAKEAMPPLAYIYHLLGSSEKAAELYLALAQKDPSKKDEMLFQAATLQVEFNKEKALQTFTQICHLGRNKVGEAAFNRVVLLYELGRHPEVLLAKEQYQSLIPKDKIPLFHLFVGKSYFALEDLKRSTMELLQFLESEQTKEKDLQIGLGTLLECAAKQEDNSLFERILGHFEKKFPESPFAAQTLFTKAIMNKRLLKFPEARESFEILFQKFPKFDNREASLYEFAHLLYLLEDWEQSRVRFKEFLTQYQESSFSPLAWRFFINSSIEMESTSKDVNDAKAKLASDLDLVLRQNQLLEEKEREELSYMLAKVSYEIEDYASAIKLLTQFLQDKPKSPLSPDLHLLLAYCFKKGNQDLEQFCHYAEQALVLNSSIQDKDTIHLNLYNAYLEMGEKNAQKTFWDEAANHLFQAYQNGVQIQETNEAWLAGFYYSKVKTILAKNWQKILSQEPIATSHAEKAILLMEKRKERYGINPVLAKETLKLTELYGMQGNTEKERVILEDLLENCKKDTAFSSDDSKEISFALANFYKKTGSPSKALELFDALASMPLQSRRDALSCLESARLRFNSTLKKDDPDLVKTLTQLKDLTIQKVFAYEPIHLEAAIDYIDILSSFENGEEKENFTILLLTKTVAEFESSEDILAKDYQNGRKAMPEKEDLYLSYLSLMDAELLLAKANLSKLQLKPEEEKNYRTDAYAILRELEKYPITAYLQARVLKDLVVLNKDSCDNF